MPLLVSPHGALVLGGHIGSLAWPESGGHAGGLGRVPKGCRALDRRNYAACSILGCTPLVPCKARVVTYGKATLPALLANPLAQLLLWQERVTARARRAVPLSLSVSSMRKLTGQAMSFTLSTIAWTSLASRVVGYCRVVWWTWQRIGALTELPRRKPSSSGVTWG